MTRGRTELELIESLRHRSLGDEGGAVVVGVGDDCAVLAGTESEDLLVTTDLLIEERHFRLPDAAPADIGWKALAVSVSDVAAMGGRAVHALVTVALRPELTGDFADRFLDGLLACAARHGVALVGGDTSSSPGPLAVTTTVIGTVARGRAVLRSGARPGDLICVTGALGGAGRGRHLRPEPRQEEALELVQTGDVHAMIDLSDGLSTDLGHVLDASGVGAELWADAIPIHADADAASHDDGVSTLDHALHDGEDFELLFALDAEGATAVASSGLCGTPVTVIGTITEDRAYQMLPTHGATSQGRPVERRGFDHFRSA